MLDRTKRQTDNLNRQKTQTDGQNISTIYLRQILQCVDNFMDLLGAGEQTLLDRLVEEERGGAGGGRRHPTLARRRRNSASDLLDKLLAVIVANVKILGRERKGLIFVFSRQTGREGFIKLLSKCCIP